MFTRHNTSVASVSWVNNVCPGRGHTRRKGRPEDARGPCHKYWLCHTHSSSMPKTWTQHCFWFSRNSQRHFHHQMLAIYRPVSITRILSKIFEHVISGRLSRYLEHSHMIPANRFAYQKNLGTTDELLFISWESTSSWPRTQSQGSPTWFLCSFRPSQPCQSSQQAAIFGVGGPVPSILTQFLTDCTHRVRVDGCYSDWYSVHSGVPKGNVLGPCCSTSTLQGPYAGNIWNSSKVPS